MANSWILEGHICMFCKSSIVVTQPNAALNPTADYQMYCANPQCGQHEPIHTGDAELPGFAVKHVEYFYGEPQCPMCKGTDFSHRMARKDEWGDDVCTCHICGCVFASNLEYQEIPGEPETVFVCINPVPRN